MIDKEFEKNARNALNTQIESLDSETLLRLKKAREAALLKQNKPHSLAKWLTGAGAGLALAGILGFFIIPSLMQSNSLSPLDDLEILTAVTELELYTQMDFYQWLDDSALSEDML